MKTLKTLRSSDWIRYISCLLTLAKAYHIKGFLMHVPPIIWFFKSHDNREGQGYMKMMAQFSTVISACFSDKAGSTCTELT